MNSTATAVPHSAPEHSLQAGAPAAAFAVAVLLVWALQLGSLVGLLGFLFTGSPAWALVGLARDVIGAALLLFGLHAWLTVARGAPLPASARWALFMVLVFALLGLMAASPPLVLALNLRRMVFLPLIFIAIGLINWSPSQIHAMTRSILLSSLLVAVLGIAEWLAPQALWTDVLDIDAFKSANPFDRFAFLPFQDSGRFFTWDFEAWTGVPLRRAISSYLEPTTLAAGLTAALVLALAERARGVGAAAAAWWLLAVCAVLTFAKSFLIFLPLLGLWRLLGTPSPRHVLWITALSAGVALAASAAGLVDGPLAHVEGLASALRFLAEGHWLGAGIGEGGNYSDAESAVGAESGFGNVVAQVGLAAVLPLLWLRAVANEVLERADAEGDPGGPWLAAWVLFWLVAYLFSASSLGVGGNALGFALMALYLHPNRVAGPQTTAAP
jgi:hypothetical protein